MTEKIENPGKKKILSVVLIAFLLLSVVFIVGCLGGPASSLKSERDVGQAVTNVSQDIEDVSQILNDIDEKLG